MERIADAQSVTAYNEAVEELRSSDTWQVDDANREYFQNTWISESKASTFVYIYLTCFLIQSLLVSASFLGHSYKKILLLQCLLITSLLTFQCTYLFYARVYDDIC